MGCLGFNHSLAAFFNSAIQLDAEHLLDSTAAFILITLVALLSTLLSKLQSGPTHHSFELALRLVLGFSDKLMKVPGY